MVNRIIPISSNDDKIYRQILTILNFIIKLTPQEIDVLSELIKLNHEYSALPELKRARFILSKDIRKDIRDLLNIPEKQFNGILGKMRNKTFMGGPILTEDGVVHPELLFKPDEQGFKIEIILDKSIVVRTNNVQTHNIEPIVEQSSQIIEETIVNEEVNEEIYNDVPPGPVEGYVDEDMFDTGYELIQPE